MTATRSQVLIPPPIAAAPVATGTSRGLVQRCSCGGAPGPSGECAECRRKRARKPAGPVQTKLRVSSPGDPLEREADRVAERVMRMPVGRGYGGRIAVGKAHPGAGAIARQAEPDEDERLRDEDLLSMKAGPGGGHDLPADFSSRLDSIRRGGTPLESELQGSFGQRFGHDFSRVRVHTDPAAQQSARSIHARAYTVGNDIVFAPGQYRPAERAGQALIAHELTHVLQQSSGTDGVMRACDCSTIPGARGPTAAENTLLSSNFPRLVAGDWCVLAPGTKTYNCIAWSVGNTSEWIWDQVDGYGDGDGTVSISDFDAFYDQTAGLVPAENPSSNTQVALFAKGSTPTHAAAAADITSCGSIPFTSKFGASVRAAHDLYQIEGGSVYGNIVRYYDR